MVLFLSMRKFVRVQKVNKEYEIVEDDNGRLMTTEERLSMPAMEQGKRMKLSSKEIVFLSNRMG